MAKSILSPDQATFRASFYSVNRLTAEIEFRAANAEAAHVQALRYPAQDGADVVIVEPVRTPVVPLRDRTRALMLAGLAGQWALLLAFVVLAGCGGGGRGGDSAANGSPGSGLEPPIINPAPGALDLERTGTVAGIPPGRAL